MSTNLKRIAIIVGAGFVPGMNAAIKGAAPAAGKLAWDVVGIRDGFEGLLHPERYSEGGLLPLTPQLVENLDPASVTMLVGGFGVVPASMDPLTKVLSWTVNRRFRQQTTEISVQWSLLGKPKPEDPMVWTFLIDREAAYQAGAGK